MSNEPVLNGRYRLVAQQGSGGMAVIYKALDQMLGRTVAVKVLRPSLTNDPAFLERFRNEARSVANLSHPNIVTVHDVGMEGETPYIVMEYVEGQDLKKIIRAQGALSVDRALSMIIPLCQGLGFAHRAGLVHADVKPQNVLVTDEDVVKITDFGIAQAFSDTQPREKQSVVWGSPHYFAPEQARGEKPTPASDVYSLGIMMFEMLTGELPYSGSNQQELALAHIRDDVPLALNINPAVPENLARIVQKVMSKEPAARYRRADQLANILVAYRDRGQAPTIGAPPAGSPPPQDAFTGPRSEELPIEPPPHGPLQTQQPANLPSLSGAVSEEPTLQYGAAPRLPDSEALFTAPPQNAPLSPANLPPPPQSPPGSSGRFRPQSRQLDSEPVSEFDVVTIILALMAFMAVALLIPLYILVFLARAG